MHLHAAELFGLGIMLTIMLIIMKNYFLIFLGWASMKCDNTSKLLKSDCNHTDTMFYRRAKLSENYYDNLPP